MLILFSEVLKIRMLEDVGSTGALVCVVDEHLQHDILALCGNVRNEFADTLELLLGEVEFHVCGVPKNNQISSINLLLKFLKQILGWRSEDIVDFVDLVELVVSGEERKQAHNLKHHAANAPDVHLVAVVAIGEKTLGRAVPSS